MTRGRRFAPLLAALLLAAALTGCGGGETPAPTPTAAVPTVSAPTAPPEPTKGREGDALRFLSCVSGCEEGESGPELLALDGGRLLLAYSRYDVERDIFTTRLQVVDALSDCVTAETCLDGSLTPVSAFEGGFIMEDYEKTVYRFLGDDLRELSVYDPPEMPGLFSPDGESYYFISVGKLWAADVDTAALTYLPSEYSVRYGRYFQSGPTDGGWLFLNGDSALVPVEGVTLTGVDLSTGKTRLLSQNIYDASAWGDELTFHMTTAEGRIGMDDPFYAVSLAEGTAVRFAQDRYAFSTVKNSEYLVCFETDDSFRLTGLYVGAIRDNVCELSLVPEEVSAYTYGPFAYMAGEELIAVSMTSDEGQRLGIVDTRLLKPDKTLTGEAVAVPELVDSTLAERYAAAQTLPAVPEHLTRQRQRADELEERYGITIYLSSQCRDVATAYKDYVCTDEFFADDPAWEIQLTDRALNDLEAGLAKYPEGFFRQFRTVTGDAGLRLCLTGEITDSYSAAFAFSTDEWYDMVFDIRFDVAPNLPHELWHCMEIFINRQDSALLSDEAWLALDPPGFTYTEDYENYLYDDYEYCYPAGEWYFYDTYSKVNAREDKARLMEVVMSPDRYDSAHFVTSPHIQQKLTLLCKAVRAAFDTTDWGEVYWERFQ